MSELLIATLIILVIGLALLYWQQRNTLQQTLLSAEASHQARQQDVRKREEEIARLRAALHTAQQTASAEKTQLEGELATHRQTLAQTEQTLASRETAYTALRDSMGQLETDLRDLRQRDTDTQQALGALTEAREAAARDSAYHLALALTLANAAFDALLVIDQDCQVLAVNTAAEEVFSIEKHGNRRLAELTGTPALEMMVEDVLANEEEILEEQMTVHDRIYLVRAQVIRRDSHLFIGLALQEITQLIRLNRARRDMVANISHELRTPIANIRLIIDGLFHDQDKPKRKDSISSLRAIARETDALLWLVQEMADLSMIESGQAIVRMIDVPLLEVVNEAIERLSNQMAAKNLRIVRHVPEKIHVLCDRDLIQRVVMNLLHNAMKWSPSDDAITINAVSDDEEVVINVFDNGPGVPDDQVDRIFERFYQVDASRSGGEGTGLGLAICKHIVVAHGGRIWAEGNSKGSGGRFKFTLLSAESPPEIASHLSNGVGDTVGER
jgi:two-component system phosphate regulon sensor histidine kinase PhoR